MSGAHRKPHAGAEELTLDDNSAATAVLVPLIGMFFVFGLPITAWIVFRWLAHRERMEMIRAGMVPPVRGSARDWRQATVPAPAPAAAGSDQYTPESAQRQLRKGITLTFIGIALTIGLSLIGHHDGGWRLGPWLLGGLIPTFVGIAQVVNALLFGATFGPAAQFGAQQVPQAPAAPGTSPGAGPTPTTYDGSYTYRPGGAQELQPPYSPPERRP